VAFFTTAVNAVALLSSFKHTWLIVFIVFIIAAFVLVLCRAVVASNNSGSKWDGRVF
jgi:hypothetical protein